MSCSNDSVTKFIFENSLTRKSPEILATKNLAEAAALTDSISHCSTFIFLTTLLIKKIKQNRQLSKPEYHQTSVSTRCLNDYD